MIDLIQNNLAKIVDACRQHKIESLYLIGSAAREKDFKQSSDVDFLFTTKKTPETDLTLFDYFDFLWKLEEIIGKKVDLVSNERIKNKYFLQSINKDKIKIYEA